MITKELALDFTCPRCKAQPGEDCNVRNNDVRHTVHVPRLDLGIWLFNREQGLRSDRADANYHVIVAHDYVGREPVILVQVEKNAYGRGSRYRATFGCPWCGDQHSHAISDKEYREPTRRVSRCSHHAAPQHYWLVVDRKAVPK